MVSDYDLIDPDWGKDEDSLNPCFSGRWSLTIKKHIGLGCIIHVLILVLVEDGL